ncbi:hypothetical protein [Pseudomonas violetae]|jgi:hypothetical protein|uniref:Uncharacterized protein n=1 Tax=Pseudomonas violetae TaxID=2915813 RepID=A0ABT0EYC4_9PSED|nr:hypothetical protein [Pseudomonas violetae]MCK1790758.1 hypothetical protein [Pseudomonas violetae]
MSVAPVSSPTVSFALIDQKVVHKKEINKLLSECKKAKQSAKKFQQIMKNSLTPPAKRDGNVKSAYKLLDSMKSKHTKIEDLKSKVEDSSYNHAAFKSKALEKITDNYKGLMSRLEVACEAKSNAFRRLERTQK